MNTLLRFLSSIPFLIGGILAALVLAYVLTPKDKPPEPQPDHIRAQWGHLVE